MRNRAAVITKVSGASASPSTHPMPATVAMLNGGWASPNRSIAQRLTMPMRGCSRKIQPIATVKPGISSPVVIAVKSAVLPGRSVRSASHAIGIPKTQATSTATDENSSVLTSTM